MKQMFDMSEKLISEQSDEIYGVKTINWESSSWKYLSLSGDEEVISLSHAKVYFFQILCYALERYTRTSNQILHGKTDWRGPKSSPEYRALDSIDGEPMEFEWNIFPGFTTMQLCTEVQELLSRLSVTPE